MKILLLLSSVFIFATTTLAQVDEYNYHLKDRQASFKKVWKKAKKEKAEQHINDALGLYEAAVQMDSTNPILLYEVATLYQDLGAYVAAHRYYNKLVDLEETSFGDLYLRRGSMQQILGQYAAAINSYNTYKRQVAANMQEVDMYIEQCREAISLLERQDCAINFNALENLKDPVNDNSGETAEFSPYYENGELYFSRFQYANEEGSRYQLNSYKHKATNVGVQRALPTENQSAYLVITPDGNSLYEVACSESGKKFDNQTCRIYRRDRKSDGNWSKRIQLPESINAKESINTQPAIGTDTEGNTYLYFASNRSGGQGGMDIWRSEIDKIEGRYNYGTPTNLTQINTPDDEISPYYHQKCHTFYFSSNRRPSLGGFDIYQTIWNGANYGWSKADHLCYPINGSFDDVDFFRTATGEKVYFASKRVPEEEREGERLVKGCCLDIFEAEAELPVYLEMTVKCGSDTVVNDAYYTSSGMTSKEIYAESADSLRQIVNPIVLVANEQYIFDVSKTGWTSARLELPTNEVCEPKTYRKPVYIRPNSNLYINVSGRGAGKNTVLDFAKIVIESELGIRQEKETVSGETTFNVEVGTEPVTYTVQIEREDYETESLIVTIPPITERCITTLDVVLKPDLPLDRELAVDIYFHDDIPAIENYRDVRDVNVSYEDTYQNYNNPNMRERYKRQLMDFYEANNEQVSMDDVEVQIDSFFLGEVQKGFEELELMAYSLLNHFTTGTAIPLSVEITGSASPTARTPGGILYNQYLSTRRINSVKNYFKNYADGELAPYINNGQLDVREVPVGQNLGTLSEAERDKIKNNNDTYGIYAPRAAGTRKVTIAKVRLQQPN